MHHFIITFTELSVDMRELEFGNVIGRGSFAVVYRGCWKGKDVALKQIRVPCGNIATVLKEVSILRLV
jgi:predicted Ser/Thr protein kinase